MTENLLGSLFGDVPPLRRDARRSLVAAPLPAAAPVAHAPAARPQGALAPTRLLFAGVAAAVAAVVAISGGILLGGGGDDPTSAAFTVESREADAAEPAPCAGARAGEGGGLSGLARCRGVAEPAATDAPRPAETMSPVGTSPHAEAPKSGETRAPAPLPEAPGAEGQGAEGQGAEGPGAQHPPATPPPGPGAPAPETPAPRRPAPPPAPDPLHFLGLSENHTVGLLGIRVLGGYTLTVSGEPGATASVSYGGEPAGSLTFDATGRGSITFGRSLVDLGLDNPMIRVAYSDGTAGAAIQARRDDI
ncbi:hypothetical protein [Microbacterium sp.]|uniref:hypothetical protein n=1 Tax=Microbacterium sp. TaxID=51671 RepID=UPI00281201A5|nr:hypothetical protein [Microbacterium sp.]